MIEFEPLPLADAMLLRHRGFTDERGDFSRLFCSGLFGENGLPARFCQMNRSSCLSPGVLRGLHYQVPPYAEAKLLHCVKGCVVDVMVDVRAGSPTLLDWHTEELSEGDGVSIFIPAGFAHGYVALTAGATVEYLSSTAYAPAYERLVRWNDPMAGVEWPIDEPQLSDKDANAPLLPRDFGGIVL